MRKIGFIPNTKHDISFAATRALIQIARAQGAEPFVSDALYPALSDAPVCPANGELGEKVDFFVVLGGDGTVLRAAQYAAPYDKPLIGFNLGNLGYLTDAEGADAALSLQQVLAGSYKPEKRLMLAVEIDGLALSAPLTALNDVCVTRGALSKMIGCHVYVNDDYIDTYHADGLIVCTPTGSTAYNLSAGGPILKPELEAMAITPVCPHKLYAKSSVIPAHDVVVIRMADDAPEDVTVSMDGRNVCTVGKNAIIRVKRSAHDATILRTNELGFYDILRSKML